MPALAPSTLFDLPDTSPAPAVIAAPSGITVLSYGLGADSTAILLKFLAHPERYGLAPDLSDLIVVHAVTGDEWPDSLDYVDRLILPRLRRAGVRLVQIARAGRHDADGVLVLDDSRSPRAIFQQGPMRLSDELREAGTVPQIASGRRTCSLRWKGFCLDQWAAAEFGGASFRRVIGYHYGELGRAEKDTRIQRLLNAEAGRTICEPFYPLILAQEGRQDVEDYVLEQLGEPIRKSYCAMCPFSGVCASRSAHEQRLREHPHIAADVLRMEHVSMALNERSSLYGSASLYRRLTEDGRNRPVLRAFEELLDQAPYAIYEVRRIFFAARTADCREHHGRSCRSAKWWCRRPRTEQCRADHPDGGFEPWCPGTAGCRGAAAKGTAWRSVRTVWEGGRSTAEHLVREFAREHRFPLRRGEMSEIERAHYLTTADGYPAAAGYLVAAPAGVRDKQRQNFEAAWTRHTGDIGSRWTPLRELPPQEARRLTGGKPLIRQARTLGGVTFTP
ncbi:hypothetical protein [Streptomyces sp. MJM1172]|uniref:hypothetical protein n=1 Tax=Streptomyces sp. MJM1172 TaxID=1703926 RepID=UPI00093D9818|nr:hypothetical protein [Streptomyces sp. MJM1172]